MLRALGCASSEEIMPAASAEPRLPGIPARLVKRFEPPAERDRPLPEFVSAMRADPSERRRPLAARSALASLTLALAIAALPAVALAQSTTLPGEFAFRTKKGYYLTAIDGGGRSTFPTIITAATTAGPWEKFRIVVGNPPPAFDKSFQTATGNYVTAVNGGDMTSDALHTDATQIRAWEQFRMNDLSVGNFAATWYSLYTVGGRNVTAVGAGGHYEDAIHTDATHVDTWEEFRPVKCGDLGSGFDYYIIPNVVPADGWALSAPGGGGRLSGAVAMGYGSWPESRFKLMLQPDGSYALQTSSGVNFVTALGGGGQVQVYEQCHPGFPGACISGLSDIFHTDATQVRGWEKFRIVDQGSCKYTIQTASGFFFGLYQTSHGMLFTTRRSVISDNEKFELVMSNLGSPPILH
jgi:hypothetical protein